MSGTEDDRAPREVLASIAVIVRNALKRISRESPPRERGRESEHAHDYHTDDRGRDDSREPRTQCD